MAKELNRDDARAALHGVVEALEAQFTDRRSEDRLTQIRFHTDTAAMAVDHLFEEEERRQAEKAERIARIQADEEA
jgi:hypothetical protein